MNEQKKIRTRFAPSPTGYMHVGGVRTALFAWLVARQAGGEFILRIEDTDRSRHIEESEQQIIDSLKWLGITWDEGPDIGGPCGPYRQSERLEIYKEWAQKLIDAGRAYVDPYSQEELEQLRKQSSAAKKPFMFRDYRKNEDEKWDGTKALRFKSEPKAYTWHDEVLGDLSAGEEAVDDFVIMKADGFPTYNFAHIVDDELMQASHVIRSSEFLSSVPRFLNLYEALGLTPPILATPPVVLGPDGKKKLSKRDGAKDILSYKKDGYLQEALINFMTSLGWNDGTEQEIFSIQELTKKFSLQRVQRSGAQFDEKRLEWMNGHYIRQLSVEELAKRVGDFWPDEASHAETGYKNSVLALIQERLKHFSELPDLSKMFFCEPTAEQVLGFYKNPSDKQLNMDLSQYAHVLLSVSQNLEQSNFSYDDIKARLNSLLTELDTKPAILFPIVRIALFAGPVSPELFGSLKVLGKDRSLIRLKTAIETLKKD